MALFKKNPNVAPKTPLNTYAAARSNLLLVVVFTAINVILRLVSADLYFLFSASTPLALLDIAALVEVSAVTAAAAVLAFVIIGLYLLCWALSKKHPGWMTVALVLFAVDAVVLVVLYDIGAMIIDLLMHVWVLYYLISGVAASAKMKKMSPEELAAMAAASQPAAPAAQEIPAPTEVTPAPAVDEAAAVPAATDVTPAPAVLVNGEPVTEE